jgi:release factor glutamine methyltransferase
MQIERVVGFRHLRKEDLRQPLNHKIFFDPADTEVGAWVGCDLIQPGCFVVDLGSGSGAAAGSFVRCGAGRVLGVDVSEESITWAREHYSSPAYPERLSFARADFMKASTVDLLGSMPETDVVVVTSNPAYVPLPETGACLKSIYAGPDGLRFVPDILRHAVALNARLGLTIGSYSSPRRAMQLLDRAGYAVRKITLAALALGDFTRRNPERILELEREGEAVLWRSPKSTGYLIVGLSCGPASSSHLSVDQLMAILSTACSAAGIGRELLSASCFPELDNLSVRELMLPDPSERQHC